MIDDIYTIDLLIQKILTDDKQYDLSKIITAYEFADKAHMGQTRSSGEPYIVHPLAVGYILLELGMDTDTICAAMLHDVVEDTPVTLDEVRKRFGQDVAMLVDGVTKLNKVPMFNKEEQQAENVRKMMLAMSQDIRVIIIKLCDRLHNMRTLSFRPGHKQRNTALETMHIYAPIAHRLGIRAVKDELEDLAFHYLDPYAYSEIEHIIDIKKGEREEFISTIKERIANRLRIEEFESPPYIEGRVKSIYAIYKKIFINNKTIDEVYDKYAVRIIVTTVGECYNVLGIMHDMFRPLPNRFKDYISTPKPNMYQSLHTTVLGRERIPFEVQIRSWDMHYTAEYGIAAHWKYKEGIQGKDKMEQRLAWVRQVIEAQQTSDDVEEIVRIIKNDIALEDIVVMTPKGDSITLPTDSTPIDFAYKIHSQIGHNTVGAKVDGKMVPLDYKLQTGQIVEILTSKEDKAPNRDWINIVKTNEAKSKMRSWFKKERREENIITGKAELEKEFKRFRIDVPEEHLPEFLSDDLKKHNCSTIEDFYASVGYGGITLSKIMTRLRDSYIKKYGDEAEKIESTNIIKPKHDVNRKSGIVLDNIDDVLVKFSQCCNPLPGDEIVGFITRGHGISVHTQNCTNYKSAMAKGNNLERWVGVEWTNNVRASMRTGIKVIANDRVGLMYDISAILADAKIPINHSSSRILKSGNAIFEASINISGKEQLNNLFERLKKVKDVISVDKAGL
ncbi:MAG: bifunctional (p)ppGpp synthetase/guanosine-3',5'-bis(diphosphate) 3'-pyrophosphohydrolase [Clostridiales bacterium]|nr:bifunctional (p)ppGpp synthetase/guanosine-3',5'-bis(diphosphate) 3'-pyrophosphohydrolase [Clostridiales bacterium]